MKHNRTYMLLTGCILLLLAACGNESHSGQAPSDSQSKTAAQQPSYKELYRTSLFLGDSITEGLSYHDVLNEENVLAGAGKTAQFALMDDDVETLIARKPERIFIQLGSDDLLWPTDDPKAYSLLHYAQLIDSIHKGLPDARITLLSVTPVTAEMQKKEPRYEQIDDYNAGLEALAAQKQVSYIDLKPLVMEHADLYDSDGVHFQAAFYPLLLDFLNNRQMKE